MSSEDPVTRRRLREIGISGALAVALGALGAHWLKGKLSADQLAAFETGVRYHLVHVLAAFASVILSGNHPGRYLRIAYTFFFWGITLFSGSLYLLSLKDLLQAPWLSVMGPVTPAGGLCFIIGWICIAMQTSNKR